MSYRDLVVWEDDFHGSRPLSTAEPGEGPWVITDTSPAGTPTYTSVSPCETGEVALAFDAQAEAQNVCLSFGDVLSWKLNLIQSFHIRCKITASLSATTMAAFGLASARNDTLDSVAKHAWFRMEGSNAVLCETDDSVTDLDDKATGQTLVATHKWFCIDFTKGLADVRFFMDDAAGNLRRVAAGTTFGMSAEGGSSVQPLIQIQKTSDTNVNAITIDYIRVEMKRAA
jgi:hypothetical protein